MTKLRTHAKKRIQPVATIAEPAQGLFESRADQSPLKVTAGASGTSSAAAAVQTKPAGHQLGQVSVFPTTDVAVQRKRRTQEQSASPLTVQPKLTVGQPGDLYEQEADRVAAQVVDRLDQRNAIAAQAPQAVQKKAAVATQPSIQPLVQAQGGSGGMAAPAPLEQSINAARSGGASLADDVKQPMEQAFGADFGGVKVHTDGTSDKLNRSLNSQAFTTKNDIFFKQGAYNPGDRAGKQLLAHELTHVVQQSGGMVQRSPMYVQRWEWGKKAWGTVKKGWTAVHDHVHDHVKSTRENDERAKKDFKKGWTWVHDTVKSAGEDFFQKPASEAETNTFKDDVKKGVDESSKTAGPILQKTGEGVLSGIADSTTYGWTRDNKKRGIAEKLKTAKSKLRKKVAEAVEAARSKKDEDIPVDASDSADMKAYKKSRRQAMLSRYSAEHRRAVEITGTSLKDNADITGEMATDAIYSEVAKEAAKGMASNIQTYATSAIETYKASFPKRVDNYFDGTADGVGEHIENVIFLGGAKDGRRLERRKKIKKDKDSFKKEVVNIAHESALSDAKSKVEEAVSNDSSLIENFADALPKKLEEKQAAGGVEKAVQQQLNGPDIGEAILAEVISFLAGEDDASGSIDLSVDFPIPNFPGFFIQLALKGEAERDTVEDKDGKNKSRVTAGAEVTIGFKGKLDAGVFKVEALAELGGYIETTGKDAKEAAMMFSFALYRRFMNSGAIPKSIPGAIWGMNGLSGKDPTVEAEQWAKAVKSSMSELASDETGLSIGASAGANAGEKNTAQVGGSVSVKRRMGTRYTKDDSNGKNRERQDTRAGFKKFSPFFGGIKGEVLHREVYEDNQKIDDGFTIGVGYTLPSGGHAEPVFAGLDAIGSHLDTAVKQAGISWSEDIKKQQQEKSAASLAAGSVMPTVHTALAANSISDLFSAKKAEIASEIVANSTAAKSGFTAFKEGAMDLKKKYLQSQTTYMIVWGGGKKANEPFWKHSIALKKRSDMEIGGSVAEFKLSQDKTIWKWKP